MRKSTSIGVFDALPLLLPGAKSAIIMNVQGLLTSEEIKSTCSVSSLEEAGSALPNVLFTAVVTNPRFSSLSLTHLDSVTKIHNGSGKDSSFV